MGWESNNIFQVLIITGSAGSGLFAYTPAPGAGNLISSITPAAGTDLYGNHFVAGVADYLNASNVAVSFQSGKLVFFRGTLAAGWTAGSSAQDDGAGGINFQMGGHTLSVNTGLLAANQGATVVGGLTADTVTITSAGADPVLSVANTAGAGTAMQRLTLPNLAALGIAIGVLLAGDANNRISVDVDASGNPRIRMGGGTVAPETILSRTAANLLSLLGADLDIATVGRGLRVIEGANAKQGTATLAAGTVVVANTSVTANSRIFLTAQNSGAAPGALRVSARTAGTSFTITSTAAGDTSLVAWEMFEPG